VLRSDVIRKRLLGVAPETPLPASAYCPGVTRRVFDTLRIEAGRALTAGQSVVVDAVFARVEERRDIAAVAGAPIPFTGLWLEGPPALLASRLASRRGDASDATPAVLDVQLGYDLGRIDWRRLDAHGSSADVLSAARRVLVA
jgi:predicted kinase